MTDESTGKPRRNVRRRALLGALAALAIAFVALLLVSPLGPEPEPSMSVPATTPPSASTSPAPSASATPSAPPVPSATAPSVPPPTGQGVVGDYACLTLVDATASIERDGFELGEVAYTLEGGPVDDSWLVSRQTPSPGELPPAGSAVDLILSSPFLVCSSP